jgi:hypothetical protein
MTRSLSSVTAPIRAKRLPLTVTPSFTVIDSDARMIPAKLDAVPTVADVATCQITLRACAPLMSTTDDAVAVVRVVPI